MSKWFVLLKQKDGPPVVMTKNTVLLFDTEHDAEAAAKDNSKYGYMICPVKENEDE